MKNTAKHPLLRAVVPVLAGAALMAFATAAGAADNGIKVGVLTCKQVPGGFNLLIHSVRNVQCTFENAQGQETYHGETGVGLGIDFEWDKNKTIVYAVFSAVNDTKLGANALAGKYVGAKASVAAGVGVGVQVLLGGGGKNITLQPIAVEGSEGIGIAAGASYLYLEAIK